jgi:hypothetical protein
MKNNFFTFLAALLFGGGLELSQMTNPEKVRGFLDITRSWDPSLIFVMVGAIALNTIAYFFWVKGAEKPLFHPKFLIPSRKDLNFELIVGALFFGLGWGMAGFCPGPALAGLFRGQSEIVILVISMLAGMGIYSYLYEPIANKIKK